ncbi:hypothetical protein PIB30_061923 [Stylosanthes scabra]|uniref:Putative plant transposon protein domain-containing protein n=1 Tax=Stylosanthes scabra TaxID=79078 RepID=A0ABU6QMT2_9FABA|nr:hypothetical protein [Stylosanthes scabra]
MASFMRTHLVQQWPSRFCSDPFVPFALSGHFRSELRLLYPETLKRTHQGIVTFKFGVEAHSSLADMSSSSSEGGDILDEHCFRSLYNQKLFEETVSKKEIIPEVGFNCNEEYPEVIEHIYKRGWRRLVSPKTEVSKTMIREFYANANRSKEEMEDLEVHPYTSYIRGVQINFSSTNIRRVMRFKEETPGAENNFDNMQTRDPQLDAVIRDLCIQGATWKMGTGRNPKPIQLRRQELRPLARGWQELIIHNIIPTGNKSEITISRAVLIHSIMQGDDVRAEELITDNMVIIAQGIEGKGFLGFPSTIYKICKEAGVRMREFKHIEQVPEERYITVKVMEAIRIPRMIQQN